MGKCGWALRSVCCVLAWGLVFGLRVPSGIAEPPPRVRLHLAGASGSAPRQHWPRGRPVKLAVRLEPGDRAGQVSDCWLSAQTPFGLYSYNRHGWYKGNFRLGALRLRRIRGRTVLKKDSLPKGTYVFTACVDENADGVRDCTWRDDLTLVVD